MAPIPDPFRFPGRGDRAVDTVLVGGGLHLAAVFVPVVPLVLVLGYLVVLLGETAQRDRAGMFDALPPFWAPRAGTKGESATANGDAASDGSAPRRVLAAVLSLARTGVGSAFVVAAYLLPATLTLLVTVAGVAGVSADSISTGASVGFLLGSTTSLLLATTFAYLLPAALGRYATSGRLRAAFAPGFLATAATDAGYFYDVVAGAVVGATLLVLADVLTVVVLGFFLAFYGELVAVGFWARGVGRVLPAE